MTADLSVAAELWATSPVLPDGRTLRADTVDRWSAYGARCVRIADRIRRRIDVATTSEGEPYVSSASQSADIAAGRFLVSRAHCDHPIWTPEQNVAFRIVHDVLGHHRLGLGFDPIGELGVWRDAVRHGHDSIVLWSESVAQLGYCLAADGFADEQKCVLR